MTENLLAAVAWGSLIGALAYLEFPKLRPRHLGLTWAFGNRLGGRLEHFLDTPAGIALLATLGREDGPELVQRWGAIPDADNGDTNGPEAPLPAR